MYRLFFTGISYLFLGYIFSKNNWAHFCDFLYGLGVPGFLSAALILGGWKPDQSVFWLLIYPVLVFGTLLLSVHLKKKVFLIWGVFFLISYIFKITTEYFSKSLGWPLSLVILGFSMIGIGYMLLSLKRNYFSNQENSH